MALPKEPRQKMVNMMYLVLTALLALNVSSEILNAFKTVNQSLINANNTIEQKNSDLFKSFQKKLEDPASKERAERWLPKAQQAKKLADDLVTYLNSLKTELKKNSGLEMVDGQEQFKMDNLDAASRVFVEGQGAKGPELKKKLEDFKASLLNLDPEIKAQFANSLPIDLSTPKSQTGEAQKSWERTYFYMTPTIAAITILTKFENDIRNSESSVVNFCHQKVGEVELVYDEFAAIASANSTYLLPGEDLEIYAGVGAFSAKALPSVSIGGASVPLTDGMATWKGKATGAGQQTKQVVISYTKPDGTKATVTKEIKYTIGQAAGLAVSTDKTRVFYLGLDNELTVQGAGGAEKTQVSVSGPGASTTPAGQGRYVVRFGGQQTGMAVVNATDGKQKVTLNIPVKRVPLPVATVGGKSSGPFATGQFRAQRGVAVELKDFVFEGVKYDVVSYSMVFSGKGFEEEGVAEATCNGAYFSADAQGKIRRCQPGTNVTIEEIKVSGPGGVRKLDQAIPFILE